MTSSTTQQDRAGTSAGNQFRPGFASASVSPMRRQAAGTSSVSRTPEQQVQTMIVRPYTITLQFEISSAHAPALRSAIEEISEKVGQRLEGAHSFAREQALTAAAIGLGVLRAELSAAAPAGDPHYEG